MSSLSSGNLLKYFLIQRWTSLVILISFFLEETRSMKDLIFVGSLCIKLGGIPFHM